MLQNTSFEKLDKNYLMQQTTHLKYGKIIQCKLPLED